FHGDTLKLRLPISYERSGQAVAVVTPNIHLKITTLYHRYIILINEKDRVGFPSMSYKERKYKNWVPV
ncbi:hypothetical protein ACFSUP_18975, partial [Gracilibacillus thailandensis]|uniref:hypothetical protein n=1 Tax=Gracilibacillus thailandensis TaxID=563735 RepID=UPI003633EFF5